MYKDDRIYQILKTCYGKEGLPSIMEDVMGKDFVNGVQGALQTLIGRQEQLQQAQFQKVQASVNNLNNLEGAVLKPIDNKVKIASTQVPTLLSFRQLHNSDAAFAAFHDEAAFNNALGGWRGQFDALLRNKNPEASFLKTLQDVYKTVTIALDKPEGKKPEIKREILDKCLKIQKKLKEEAAAYNFVLTSVQMTPPVEKRIETKEQPSPPTTIQRPKAGGG